MRIGLSRCPPTPPKYLPFFGAREASKRGKMYFFVIYLREKDERDEDWRFGSAAPSKPSQGAPAYLAQRDR